MASFVVNHFVAVAISGVWKSRSPVIWDMGKACPAYSAGIWGLVCMA